jgi:hypothetical protein
MILFIFSDLLYSNKGCSIQIFGAAYIAFNLIFGVILIFILFLITIFFVKEGFGIKIELFLSLLASILPIFSTILSQFPFYDYIEGYFTNTWGYLIGIFLYNFVSITIPIIKSFLWGLKRKNEFGNIKTIFLEEKERNELIKELVEGRDPNTNYKYLFSILEDLDGIDYLKEYSKIEFSIENVFLFYNF